MDIATKICTRCKVDKPLAQYFSRGGKMSHLYKSRCKTCMQEQRQQWAVNNKDYLNEWRRKNWVTTNRRLKRRGATQQLYDQLYDLQQGSCALCKEPEEKLVWLCIDHDHDTGRIRGLLCPSCNRGIGLLQDNPELLRKAADYIESSKAAILETV